MRSILAAGVAGVLILSGSTASAEVLEFGCGERLALSLTIDTDARTVAEENNPPIKDGDAHQVEFDSLVSQQSTPWYVRITADQAVWGYDVTVGASPENVAWMQRANQPIPPAITYKTESTFNFRTGELVEDARYQDGVRQKDDGVTFHCERDTSHF